MSDNRAFDRRQLLAAGLGLAAALAQFTPRV